MKRVKIINTEPITYVQIVIPGSPITKSNFSLTNKAGKKIMPKNTGNYKYDKYAKYEELIVDCCRAAAGYKQFPRGVIAELIIYYKSPKRHPDTNNMPKSIFDGIEKSGLIINDIVVKQVFLTEKYDKENPRVEVFLYDNETYNCTFTVSKRNLDNTALTFECSICHEKLTLEKLTKLNNGNGYACARCLKKEIQKRSKNKKEEQVKCIHCGALVNKKDAKQIHGQDNFVCLRCVLGR